MINVTRLRSITGKLSKYFVAFTSDPQRGQNVQICEGAPGESAAVVRARAVELLAAAVEQQCLEVRAVTPGADGRPQDVWILQGNPIVGYSYGRVYAYKPDAGQIVVGGERATLHVGTQLPSPINQRSALTCMLTHMADYYPESQWTQFLWGTTDMGADAIRREIHERDASRAAMQAREHAG